MEFIDRGEEEHGRTWGADGVSTRTTKARTEALEADGQEEAATMNESEAEHPAESRLSSFDANGKGREVVNYSNHHRRICCVGGWF